MLRAIVFGLMFGAGFQSWRNYPPDGPVTADGAFIAFVSGVLLTAVFSFGFGWSWGRLGGRGSTSVAEASAEATAIAESTSQASSTINLAVVVPGAGAGGSVAALPWFAGDKPAVTADQLDGLDLVDAGLAELDSTDSALS